MGDEALDYLLNQVVEMLNHSHNVDEIYVEDIVLRRKIARSSRSTWGRTRRSTPMSARSSAI